MSTTLEEEEPKPSQTTSSGQLSKRPLDELTREIAESLVENLKKNL